MAEPTMEPEVLAAELRRMGCPYEALDTRTTIWLEGYSAGSANTRDIALQAVRDSISESRQ